MLGEHLPGRLMRTVFFLAGGISKRQARNGCSDSVMFDLILLSASLSTFDLGHPEVTCK